MEPKERNFMDLLRAKWAEGKFVCVGLDSEFGKIPECRRHGGDERRAIFHFNRDIIESTKDTVCAYKPNWAFYLASGLEGIGALSETIMYINSVAPDVPVILDAKVGDIGNTNNGYVQFIFDQLDADAVTVHNYMGREAMKPFLDRKDKGIFVLCRTSNSGSDEFQNLPIGMPQRIWFNEAIFQRVAYQVKQEWNANQNCGLVTGATYPEDIANIRKIANEVPILIPGVGSQGGDLGKAVRAGMDADKAGFLVNSSRGIIFASSGEDFAEVARRETQKLHDAINEVR